MRGKDEASMKNKGCEEVKLVKRGKSATKSVITVGWYEKWESLASKKVSHYVVSLGGSRGFVCFASKDCAISRFHEQIGYLVMHGYDIVKVGK